MFTKKQKLSSGLTGLDNYVNGIDVYDSMLLHLLSDPSYARETYEITAYEYRPDLIAKDFYGSVDYLGILMIQTKLTLEDYKRGVVLKLIPKQAVDILLKNI